MRKVISIILYVVAGFFIYMDCVLAFINEPPPLTKFGMMAGFLVPGLIAQMGGLALNQFHNSRKITGIVLLSGAGFTAFLVFTFACLLMTDEFKQIMKPDSLKFFSDYVTGACFIFLTAACGLLLLLLGRKHPQTPTAEI
jgi:hypothetical protein